jgi:hypothetical protein
MAKIVLTPERIQQLKQAQRNLHDLLPEFDAAEQCGIECQQFRQMAGEAQDKIKALLTNYSGPTHSSITG